MSRTLNTLLIACIAGLAACQQDTQTDRQAADWVIVNGLVYSADAQRNQYQAIAVRGDRIVALGDDRTVQQWIGPQTHVHDAQGNTVLPGLHDIHIHPFGLVAGAGCDLESEPLNLQQLSGAVRECIEQLQPEPGQWLTVEQWNFTKGNQPDAQLPTIRAALDAASVETPIFLRGNDGHHGAANSAALATAANSKGEIVGLNAATVAAFFSDQAVYIGLDSQGEPDGNLSESARYLLGLPGNALTGDGTTEELAARMPAVAQLLASRGITSIQDAAADIVTLPILEDFSQSGLQTYRYTAALYSDFAAFSAPLPAPEGYTVQTTENAVNIPALAQAFSEIRQRQQNAALFKATGAKIFVDGVIEGNPFAEPPGMPNAASYQAYLQPRFQTDQDGKLSLVGYVDTESEACKTAQTRADFSQHYGFHPDQCRVTNGTLEHEAGFISQYIYQMEKSGFAVHAHAIGDRAVGLALKTFADSRRRLNHGLPQTLSHVQQMAPQDRPLLEQNPVNLTFTFAWAVPDYGYDVTVTPFIDNLDSLADLYQPDNYAMSHYPANSARLRGATITAGSDAPVDTRDPRPFVNLAAAITRAAEGRVYNENERLSLFDALDAFTINGARALQQEQLTGSLELGKKADIIVLDRNLMPLAERLDSQAIADTQVLLTLFDGRQVWPINTEQTAISNSN